MAFRPALLIRYHKRAKKRRHTLFGAAAVIVLALIILISVKLFGGDALKGVWDFDGVTVYRFDGKGTGSLDLPGDSYPFSYKINGHKLSIDFESEAARDADYTFSVKNNILTLTGGEVSIAPGSVYELTKQE